MCEGRLKSKFLLLERSERRAHENKWRRSALTSNFWVLQRSERHAWR